MQVQNIAYKLKSFPILYKYYHSVKGTLPSRSNATRFYKQSFRYKSCAYTFSLDKKCVYRYLCGAAQNPLLLCF